MRIATVSSLGMLQFVLWMTQTQHTSLRAMRVADPQSPLTTQK